MPEIVLPLHPASDQYPENISNLVKIIIKQYAILLNFTFGKYLATARLIIIIINKIIINILQGEIEKKRRVCRAERKEHRGQNSDVDVGPGENVPLEKHCMLCTTAVLVRRPSLGRMLVPSPSTAIN